MNRKPEAIYLALSSRMGQEDLLKRNRTGQEIRNAVCENRYPDWFVGRKLETNQRNLKCTPFLLTRDNCKELCKTSILNVVHVTLDTVEIRTCHPIIRQRVNDRLPVGTKFVSQGDIRTNLNSDNQSVVQCNANVSLGNPRLKAKLHLRMYTINEL